MAFCDKHTAHEEHFTRLDKRVDDLEDRDFEKTQLIARMDAILSQLQRLYWVIVTSCAGAMVTALLAVFSSRQ